MVDINENSAARKMAEDLVWRLETLQHRCRYNFKTGEYRRLPTRIRRFSNAKPLDIVASVIEELVKMAPYSGVVFCGEDNPDLKYRPITTYIRKDDTLKTGTRDATYTIVQDLLLEGEVDEYAGGDGSSCSSVSECEYHWDEADVMDCPQGGQGVSYRITGVSRDRETDLFSYEVRRVQAITQHQPEYVAECSDESVRTVETWDNVYGEPGDFRYDDVVHGGEAISLPAPCDAASGELVQVSSDEKDDCTFRVTVVRTTSKLDAEAMFLRYRDQFQIRTVDLQKNASSALSKSGVEYSGGRKTTYETESNPDGTYNNRVTVETERPVSGAVSGSSVSARFEEVSWVDRNQTSAARSLPSGYSFGSWRCTKTPGGLYDNEFSGVKPVAGAFGYECSDTAFLHSHTDSEVLAKYPSGTAHVPSASGGTVTSYDVGTDDRGIVVQRRNVRTEHSVSKARVSVTSTLLGQTTEVYSRSQASVPQTPAVGSVGSTEYQITDGKLYDTVMRTFALSPAGLRLGLGCSRTVFEHSDTVEQTAGSIGSCTSEAGDGNRYETRYEVDPSTGAVRQHTASVRELPYPSAQVSVQGTSRTVIRRYTNRNSQSAKASALLGTDAAAGYSEQRETNPGGSTDVTVTQVVPRTGVTVSESCELDVTQHTHDTEVVLDASVPAGEGMSAGGGVLRQTSVSTDDNGIATKRTRTVTEFNHTYGSRVHEDALQAHQIVEETSRGTNPGDVNGRGAGFSSTEGGSDGGSATELSEPALPLGSSNDTGYQGDSARMRMKECVTDQKSVTGGDYRRGTQFVADSELTRGGRFHSRRYKYVAKPQKWLDATVSDGNSGQYVWHFRNLTAAQCKEVMGDVLDAIDSKQYNTYACHPFIRRSMNDFGLYDGDIGFEARAIQFYGGKAADEGAFKSQFESAQELYNWWEKSVHISPISQLDPSGGSYASGEASMFLVETVWSHFVTGYGVGEESLQSYLKDKDGAFWASPRINYDRNSQVFTYTVMDKQRTKIEVVTGTALPNSASDTVFIEGNQAINDLGSPPSNT